MNQVLDFFRKLFDTSDWPPRWHCGNWTQFHGWLYIISDLLIWSAYFAMPLIILRYVSHRFNAKFTRLYFLFAAFILACGSTHLLDAITFWFPAYRLNALVRFITGVISWATVFNIIKFLPVAMSLKTHEELEKEIVEREKVEQEFRTANLHLNEAQEIARMGHWQWDIIKNKITWSDGMFKVFGLKPQKNELNYDEYLGRIHPEDKNFVDNAIQKAFDVKEFSPFVHRIMLDDGTVRTIHSKGEVITDGDGKILKMIGTGQDITEQQKAQAQILEKTHELELTNIELQRFAYVASHDLQEPLRKILTFASMLKKESEEVFNEKSKAYLEKIVHSSTRMQKLIDDILRFSSIKADSESFAETNLNTVVEQVLSDIEILINRTHATIRLDNLPVIEAIPSQIGQLFQNLISNAIKFKKENVAPVIEINCKEVAGEELLSSKIIKPSGMLFSSKSKIWPQEKFAAITIKDNGIGFEQEYAEKIFEIFQRLHTGRHYEGTGIGLAICKKIVDNHHGTISVASRIGEGSTFHIILPFSHEKFKN